MTAQEHREAYIPFRRADLIDMCIEDGKLPAEQAKTFREFCEILSAYYHFKFHAFVETLKQNYIPFDPTEDQQLRVMPTPDQQKKMLETVVQSFRHVLESANYQPLSDSLLKQAFAETSLIDLRTEVDFDDMDAVVCYYRGDTSRIIRYKRFFKKLQKTVSVFERVALLVKFKDADHFRVKKINPKRLKFSPGKIYVYLYKNIPQFDIELLFPNVKTSMTWKDRLLFWVPTVGAVIPLVLRILPNLLLIIGIVFFFLGISGVLRSLGVSEETAQDVLPILVASMSVAIALGGFAFKQYSTYQTKKIRFQKNVTDTLFFRNLANNRGVFQLLIDAAEEEECKEIILVYYHLLTSPVPLTTKQLDAAVEQWMLDKFKVPINFDIQNPLRNLALIQGQLPPSVLAPDSAAEAEDSIKDSVKNQVALFRYDSEGYCNVLPLSQAKMLLDYVWDHAFTYSSPRPKA
ncbi:MAG: TMEM143 family protein [Leptolyngbyaceae bacterium]|nr:TMEM143 family protein [Leptolyngbyaceae bacterium]